ncbi:hypothetical protein LCGC14_1629500 [marine sediment metagenome]|uniref:Uncharacterized protein n=1 Tax=marine sediment metagenome TaxID=412755 RepID=A0A0F9L2V4_9ZZZZ
MSIDKEIKKLKEIQKADFYLILETINKRTKMIMVNRKVLRVWLKHEKEASQYQVQKIFFDGLLKELGGGKMTEGKALGMAQRGSTSEMPSQSNSDDDSKPPSYENFLMIHNFEMIGTDGTCKKCGADFQKARYTPCNPSEQDAGSASHTERRSCITCKHNYVGSEICYTCGTGYPEWEAKEKEPNKLRTWAGEKPLVYANEKKGDFDREKEPTECDDCPIENHKRSDCMVCQKGIEIVDFDLYSHEGVMMYNAKTQTIVEKEDLIKDFDFLYSKIYLYLCKMRANETTDNIQSIIEMVYFYFESRKKKYRRKINHE